jgi:hypothetical protein
MQGVRIEQLDDAQGFFSSTTPPQSIEGRYKTLLDSGACKTVDSSP